MPVSYASYLKLIEERPRGPLRNEAAAATFRKWADRERTAWLELMSKDPLLPERLWPKHYLGRKAWQARLKTLPQAGEQIRSFHH